MARAVTGSGPRMGWQHLYPPLLPPPAKHQWQQDGPLCPPVPTAPPAPQDTQAQGAQKALPACRAMARTRQHVPAWGLLHQGVPGPSAAAKALAIPRRVAGCSKERAKPPVSLCRGAGGSNLGAAGATELTGGGPAQPSEGARTLMSGHGAGCLRMRAQDWGRAGARRQQEGDFPSHQTARYGFFPNTPTPPRILPAGAKSHAERVLPSRRSQRR